MSYQRPRRSPRLTIDLWERLDKIDRALDAACGDGAAIKRARQSDDFERKLRSVWFSLLCLTYDLGVDPIDFATKVAADIKR